jgi:hypothetical protein
MHLIQNNSARAVTSHVRVMMYCETQQPVGDADAGLPISPISRGRKKKNVVAIVPARGYQQYRWSCSS